MFPCFYTVIVEDLLEGHTDNGKQCKVSQSTELRADRDSGIDQGTSHHPKSPSTRIGGNDRTVIGSFASDGPFSKALSQSRHKQFVPSEPGEWPGRGRGTKSSHFHLVCYMFKTLIKMVVVVYLVIESWSGNALAQRGTSWKTPELDHGILQTVEAAATTSNAQLLLNCLFHYQSDLIIQHLVAERRREKKRRPIIELMRKQQWVLRCSGRGLSVCDPWRRSFVFSGDFFLETGLGRRRPSTHHPCSLCCICCTRSIQAWNSPPSTPYPGSETPATLRLPRHSELTVGIVWLLTACRVALVSVWSWSGCSARLCLLSTLSVKTVAIVSGLVSGVFLSIAASLPRIPSCVSRSPGPAPAQSVLPCLLFPSIHPSFYFSSLGHILIFTYTFAFSSTTRRSITTFTSSQPWSYHHHPPLSREEQQRTETGTV
ncbi:uncharacterized protein CLUP02_06975 [Colletotrichum lupini]|uniref:Uncharacterized protein n=1 Tax=Colletotrichum lupini TaxID=145971 RepID=A0A9Q8WFJ2_9PEZI|nr:uncharacterized protein CLUP02_06975 [Colletotrichum lupini]UQC81489.1 hypothetical protein CLUP02_06975 [Colletotrichum lupini]